MARGYLPADHEGPAIRTVTFEKDQESSARTVRDIEEFVTPTSIDAGSWTSLTREADQARRTLMIRLSAQIDLLVAGTIDEISIVLNG